jgi:isoleucyl-tRNA synthetase
MDYKGNIKFTKTDFPMRANLQKREPELLEKWGKRRYLSSNSSQISRRRNMFLHDESTVCEWAYSPGTALNKI